MPKHDYSKPIGYDENGPMYPVPGWQTVLMLGIPLLVVVAIVIVCTNL